MIQNFPELSRTFQNFFLLDAVWSVLGRLPLTVTGQGVLLYPRSVIQLQAPGDGTVVKQ